MDRDHNYLGSTDLNRASRPSYPGQHRDTRRASSQASEQIKHRRTRSGCFTCRQRRVKCDEGQPTCDRCRKGKRECTYPDVSSSSRNPSSGQSKSRVKGQSPGGSSLSEDRSDSDGNEDDRHILPTITDEGMDLSAGVDEESAAATIPRKRITRALQMGMSSTRRTTAHSSGYLSDETSTSKQSLKQSMSSNRHWASLPEDVQGYLKYHHDCLSYHHYALKHDVRDFLKTTFLEIALNDDSQALLYGIVAFSAYHHAIMHNDIQMLRSLKYYNHSITLLGQSLRRKAHNMATLLTVLQLATIEEFIGDWVTLLGHQRAAYQILTSLYTPATIVQDETRRHIVNWYVRFDLFAGIVSGGQLQLERTWYASMSDFYTHQARSRPGDRDALFDDYFATMRLLATDAATLVAAKNQNMIDDEQYAQDTARLTARFSNFQQVLSSTFTDSSCFVENWPRNPTPQEESMFYFRDPNFLYNFEYFAMNYVLIDFWTIDLNFKLQSASSQGQATPSELSELAMKICKMFEAIEYSGQGPAGAILGCQASLGMASLFLPKDRQCMDWLRRRFALIERHGYIYPTTLRKHMSHHWNEDVMNWWLPNDEGYPASIRAIREFVESRTADPDGAWVMAGADLRDMSGIFGSLSAIDTLPEELRTANTDSDMLDLGPESSGKGGDSSPETPLH